MSETEEEIDFLIKCMDCGTPSEVYKFDFTWAYICPNVKCSSKRRDLCDSPHYSLENVKYKFSRRIILKKDVFSLSYDQIIQRLMREQLP